MCSKSADSILHSQKISDLQNLSWMQLIQELEKNVPTLLNIMQLVTHTCIFLAFFQFYIQVLISLPPITPPNEVVNVPSSSSAPQSYSFKLVGDNIDKEVKPRFNRAEKFAN